MKKLPIWIATLLLVFVLASCGQSDGNYTGSEYMPDMAHSIAMEANTNNYYYYNTWDEASSIPLKDLVQPRVPVKGTIPRGAAGGTHKVVEAANAMRLPANGHVPYHFEDSQEGRTAATAQLIDNPFPITDKGLVQGKELYDIFCATCHGEKGNGLGYLYNDEENKNAKYPLAPANFLRDEFYQASNGRMYHAIYYGINAMGAYKDKMSYEERWNVIHHIRALQAAELQLEYSAKANTLNASFGTPMAMLPSATAAEATEVLAAESVETSSQTLKK